MIRFFITIIILFSFCCCEMRTEYKRNGTTSDSTITSDPYKTFTSDIYTSIEQNYKYQEVGFNGVMSGVNIDKHYYDDIKDSLIFVSSGLLGANFLLEIPRRIHLPDNGKKLEIEIIYEYAPYPIVTDLILEVTFFDKNTIKTECIENIPPTMEFGSRPELKTENIKKKNVTLAKYKYQIPKNANNVQATLYTYNKRAVEHLYIQNKLKDSVSITEAGASYLALKKFGFKVNGKSIEKHTYNHNISFTKQEIDEIQSTVNDNLKINENVRILGIGESIHGSNAFYNQANEIIKQLIAEGFNVIGFETSLTVGIQLNDYIKGKNNDINNILSAGVFNFYNNPVTKELFEYLKDYNQNNDNRISVFGFDIPQMDERDMLKAYSEMDFKTNDVEKFNNYLKNFYDKYGSYYTNGMSYKILQRHRDEIMSENIFYIDNSFSNKDKIALMAHLGHLCKRESPEPSAGFILSEKYGKQYEVTGLFTGKGTFLSQHNEGFNDEKIIKQFPLSTPIGKSLEQLCNSLESDTNVFYINKTKEIELLDKVLNSFYIGAGYRVMQFEPLDIRKELDNICFIKGTLQKNNI